jgi:hypothetical protein
MPSQDVILYGIDRNPPQAHQQVVQGHAGPVSFEFTDLMLRHIRIGDVEIARRIYFGLRPADWDAVYPVEVRDLKVDATSRSFKASWTAHNKRHDTDYQWSGKIVGKTDGSITFSVAGTVLEGFESPRIGLNVLISDQACAGAMFEATGKQVAQGPIRYHEFTRKVPRTQIISEIDSIRFCPAWASGSDVDTMWSFTDSNTDLEDQRNWAECTYKIFAALKHSYPNLPAGEKCAQTVALSFPRGLPSSRKKLAKIVKIKIGSRIKGATVPSIGVDLHPEDGPLSADELKLLTAMKPGHLRVRATDTDHAITTAKAADCAVHVIVDDASDASIAAVRKIQAASVPVMGVDCVDLDHEKVAALRDANLGVPIGGPAAHDFGVRVPIRTAIDAGADFIAWGVEPNHHQDDDQTYLENSRGPIAAIQTVRYYAPKCKLIIGPVNIEPLFPRPRTEARQAGLLAAAYAAGVFKCLAEEGAHAGTFFRAAGPYGVIHRKAEHPLPAFDDDAVLQVYPIYHVIKQAAALRGQPVRTAETSDHLRVEAVATDDTIILINKTAHPQDVQISGLRGSTTASARTIDTTTFNAIRHGDDPPATPIAITNGRLSLTLDPCAVVSINLS